MCLITFSWRPGTPVPLRLAGNRDEFYTRPTAPLSYWEDIPGLLGGRDLEAGGTWLAANQNGLFAVLTNVRDPLLTLPDGAPSRGELVANALQSDDIESWLGALATEGAQYYAGFNLLAGNRNHLWHLHHGRHGITLSEVPAGTHGLSNDTLNTPWPKLQAVRAAMTASTLDNWQAVTQHALHNSAQAPDSLLPNTGVGIELERQLSAAFIIGEHYGTRATTWLSMNEEGLVSITEHRFGPLGRFEGKTSLSTPP